MYSKWKRLRGSCSPLASSTTQLLSWFVRSPREHPVLEAGKCRSHMVQLWSFGFWDLVIGRPGPPVQVIRRPVTKEPLTNCWTDEKDTFKVQGPLRPSWRSWGGRCGPNAKFSHDGAKPDERLSADQAQFWKPVGLDECSLAGGANWTDKSDNGSTNGSIVEESRAPVHASC